MQIITSKIHFTFVTGNVLFQHGIWLISVIEVKSALICVGWKTPELSNVLTLYRWLEIILFNEERKFYFPHLVPTKKKKGIKPRHSKLAADVVKRAGCFSGRIDQTYYWANVVSDHNEVQVSNLFPVKNLDDFIGLRQISV